MRCRALAATLGSSRESHGSQLMPLGIPGLRAGPSQWTPAYPCIRGSRVCTSAPDGLAFVSEPIQVAFNRGHPPPVSSRPHGASAPCRNRGAAATGGSQLEDCTPRRVDPLSSESTLIRSHSFSEPAAFDMTDWRSCYEPPLAYSIRRPCGAWFRVCTVAIAPRMRLLTTASCGVHYRSTQR